MTAIGADHIIITLGMNDVIDAYAQNRTAEEIATEIGKTIDRFRTVKPGVKFIITTYYHAPTYDTEVGAIVPYLFDLVESQGDIAIINTYTSSPNATILDSDMGDGVKLNDDGTHLTDTGYHWLSSLIWSGISSQFDVASPPTSVFTGTYRSIYK
jgi:lysophospholipase L1-like esterase